MIAQLNGRLIEKAPTEVVIDCGGVGYEVKISLNTFSTKEEREMFNHLVSVSGIGPSTAMIMLSSMVPQEIASAIQNEDVRTIQSVKGIGAKTAQRVIID